MIEAFIHNRIIGTSHINTLGQYIKENDKHLVFTNTIPAPF